MHWRENMVPLRHYNEERESVVRPAPVCHFSSLLVRNNVTECFTALWESTELLKLGPVWISKEMTAFVICEREPCLAKLEE